MRVLVRKWGNSAAVRIPNALMDAAQLSLDQAVEVREEHGRIVVERIAPEAYDLATLVEGITDENRHDAIGMGAPAGNEVW